LPPPGGTHTPELVEFVDEFLELALIENRGHSCRSRPGMDLLSVRGLGAAAKDEPYEWGEVDASHLSASVFVKLQGRDSENGPLLGPGKQLPRNLSQVGTTLV
jgi:hypothetical protein